MADPKKESDNGASPAGGAGDEATAPPPQSGTPGAGVDLKPPARGRVSLPEKSRRQAEKPRREPEQPSARPRRSEQPRRGDGKTLVVAREIVLSGKIKACDRLVVEGQVEATMKDCREIEIAETGTFKGKVEFDRADISGVFEGELTAREYLVVRATGRITGKVKFGELEIERGGQIIGEVQVFGEASPTAQAAGNGADKPAK